MFLPNPPHSWQLQICSLNLWVYFCFIDMFICVIVWIPHTSSMIWYLPFWLSSFSMIMSRSLHIATNCITLLFFDGVILYIYVYVCVCVHIYIYIYIHKKNFTTYKSSSCKLKDANMHFHVQSHKLVHVSGVHCNVHVSSTSDQAFVYGVVWSSNPQPF